MNRDKMFCKLNLNINKYCEGIINIKYCNKKEKLEVCVSGKDINDLEKMLRIAKEFIGEMLVRPCYRNLHKSIRSDMANLVAKVFNTESRIDNLTKLVKKYMDIYGKYPKLTDKEKSHNYIKNIIGENNNIEEIRLRLLYGSVISLS